MAIETTKGAPVEILQLGPLVEGTLVKRYKRFLADVELDNGDLVTAHCPNTGPMTGVLHPGGRVRLRHAPSPTRKLAWTWEQAQVVGAHGDQLWVGINTALPNTLVRATIEAVTPGGEVVFLGREWGRSGDGFRVEKRYVDGTSESFRSALIDEQGEILERSHTLPPTKVPPAVLGAAMKLGRDIRRCEIVSDAVAEREWRIRCVDGGGRTFVTTVSLDGRLLHAQRLVAAELQVDAR
jgi:hypothetical protein